MAPLQFLQGMAAKLSDIAWARYGKQARRPPTFVCYETKYADRLV
jgi:hypothetical protein